MKNLNSGKRRRLFKFNFSLHLPCFWAGPKQKTV